MKISNRWILITLNFVLFWIITSNGLWNFEKNKNKTKSIIENVLEYCPITSKTKQIIGLFETNQHMNKILSYFSYCWIIVFRNTNQIHSHLINPKSIILFYFSVIFFKNNQKERERKKERLKRYIFFIIQLIKQIYK